MERLPGFRDFYPEPLPHKDVWSAALRQHIFSKWRDTARCYGFQEYDGPPLEPEELYTLKSGTEILGQLYHFTDKGDRKVALRPEMTPTLARMVASHERNYKKPLKWFAIPQLFRFERQQKGRLKEHFQFNADIIGEADPAADSEIICLLIDALRALKLTSEDFVIRLSSRNAWQTFFASRCSDTTLAYEFYQIIDKLEREDPAESNQKLNALGFSLSEVKEFIDKSQATPELESVLHNLSVRGLGEFVKIDYNVIRGLAYYTGIVFEAFDKKGDFRAIAGGGRYDNLIKLISGGKVDLPALGFGMGDVVLAELLNQRGLLPPSGQRIDGFILIEDENLRSESLHLLQSLRMAGQAVEYPLTAMRPDKQFKRALELNAPRTLRIEGSPGALTVRIRPLPSGKEEVIAFEEMLKKH